MIEQGSTNIRNIMAIGIDERLGSSVIIRGGLLTPAVGSAIKATKSGSHYIYIACRPSARHDRILRC